MLGANGSFFHPFRNEVFTTSLKCLNKAFSIDYPWVVVLFDCTKKKRVASGKKAIFPIPLRRGAAFLIAEAMDGPVEAPITLKRLAVSWHLLRLLCHERLVSWSAPYIVRDLRAQKFIPAKSITNSFISFNYI